MLTDAAVTAGVPHVVMASVHHADGEVGETFLFFEGREKGREKRRGTRAGEGRRAGGHEEEVSAHTLTALRFPFLAVGRAAARHKIRH